MPGQVLHGIQCFCILLSQWQPFLITGQLIRIPDITGEETGTPVINGYINNATILVDSSWIQNFP